MNIADARGKCKELAAKVPRDVLSIGILVLASLASFGLGYLAGLDAWQGSPAAIEESPVAAGQAPTQPAGAGSVGVVASKNGTKYYLPSCAGASRISESNKVWFTSVAAAEVAGYAPAVNCKGL